ncbi:HupE/UreJ family protein [Pseudohongiella sp.]|uniref:HupE / UreJ protein n=1 Tax=marine sediment metagenome TaxID=412755 RepID=A0A0F9W8F8_9ZZZZ|nr:HupE/UreJ family protein [Pseudohongiella sp.]HDZ08224.1 HupE/UreJ family protein [Pseudohongiella sp.]HEA63192.1 HupE/UreJ family protein [Pseudohongiella sp.]
MVVKRLRWQLAGVLFFLFSVPVALAHYMDLAQFTLVQLNVEDEGLWFRFDASLPVNLDPDLPVSWPDGCSVLERDERVDNGNAVTVSFDVNCEETSSGLIRTRWGRDGGMLELHLLDGSIASTMLSGGRFGAEFSLPDWEAAAGQEPAGFMATAWRYLVLGTEHVLIGLDHLAFVLCLAMLARGISLLWLISAFTLGHSISLALAYLGVVNVPIVPVEAIIALSVVFMAREALLANSADNGRAPTARGAANSQRWRMGITAGFGLIHGLGFASVLGGLGVSAADTVVALLFFNIGVEVGQLMFVATVLVLLALLRKVHFDQKMIRASAFAVGGMGLFWTVERVMGI